MKNKISTLEELEKEQRKLEMMMEVTRQEFARNLGTNRKQLKGFFVKKIALPASTLGLGIAVTQKITASDSQKVTATNKENIWKKLLPLGLNLLQAYFMKKQKTTVNQNSTSSQNPNTLKSVA
ncbi:MAG: hypothetical protein AB8H03_14445 [Saprospiraceae bacterium]